MGEEDMIFDVNALRKRLGKHKKVVSKKIENAGKDVKLSAEKVEESERLVINVKDFLKDLRSGRSATERDIKKAEKEVIEAEKKANTAKVDAVAAARDAKSIDSILTIATRLEKKVTIFAEKLNGGLSGDAPDIKGAKNMLSNLAVYPRKLATLNKLAVDAGMGFFERGTIRSAMATAKKLVRATEKRINAIEEARGASAPGARERLEALRERVSG